MNAKSISNSLYDRSNIWFGIIFTIVSCGFLYFVMIPRASCYELPDRTGVSLGTSFGYSYELVIQFLSERTKAMLSCYTSLLTIWDMIFAITYGFMHIFWISLIYKSFKDKVTYLNVLPILQVILDWCENLTLNHITNSYLVDGVVSNSLVQLASVFTIVKWIVYTVVIGAILIGLIFLIILKVRRK